MDIFVVHVVANLVPPRRAGDATGYTVMAAVEYGVKALGVFHLGIRPFPLRRHQGGDGHGARTGTAALRVSGPWVDLADGACREVLAEDSEGKRTDAGKATAAEQRPVLKS